MASWTRRVTSTCGPLVCGRMGSKGTLGKQRPKAWREWSSPPHPKFKTHGFRAPGCQMKTDLSRSAPTRPFMPSSSSAWKVYSPTTSSSFRGSAWIPPSLTDLVSLPPCCLNTIVMPLLVTHHTPPSTGGIWVTVVGCRIEPLIPAALSIYFHILDSQ